MCWLPLKFINKVTQEPVLFSVSLGENIAYGLPDDNVSKDDVIKAAKAANAHEFIISLPQVSCLLNIQWFTPASFVASEFLFCWKGL